MRKPLTIIIWLICVALVSTSLYILNSRTFQDRKYVLAVGYLLGKEELPVDLERAINIWTDLAEADHSASQCVLGLIYKKGHKDILKQHDQTITIDLDKAWYWANKAARQGCVFAQYQIGIWHMNDKDEQHLEHTVYWLKQVAEWGYHNAQYNLALVLLETKPQEAREFLLRASKQGHAQAIKKLGQIDTSFDPSSFINPAYENPASQMPDDWEDYSAYIIAMELISSLGK